MLWTDSHRAVLVICCSAKQGVNGSVLLIERAFYTLIVVYIFLSLCYNTLMSDLLISHDCASLINLRHFQLHDGP